MSLSFLLSNASCDFFSPCDFSLFLPSSLSSVFRTSFSSLRIPSSLHSRFLSFLLTYHRLPTSFERFPLLSLPGFSIPLPSVSRTLSSLSFNPTCSPPLFLQRRDPVFFTSVAYRRGSQPCIFRGCIFFLLRPTWTTETLFQDQAQYRRSDFYVPPKNNMPFANGC